MKTPLLALVSLIAAGGILLAQDPAPGGPAQDRPHRPLILPVPANPNLPTLFLIGASSVRNGWDDGQGKGDAGQWGWGHPLSEFFDLSKINVVNRAIGGMSTRTYLTSGNWDKTLALIKPGDFVLIQFGTNDSGSINDRFRARATIPGVGDEQVEIDNMMTHKHEVVHSHGWYLRKFIEDARAKGATPIVCSMSPHKLWDLQGKIRRNTDFITWTREVAQQEGIGFINLNEIVAERYDALGHDAVMKLFPQVVPDEHDHTNMDGARFVAQCVISGLKLLNPDPLAAYFSDAATGIAAADPSTLEAPAPAAIDYRFQFGAQAAAPGYTLVAPGTAYNPESGYGFEPGSSVAAVAGAGDDPLHAERSPRRSPSRSRSQFPRATTGSRSHSATRRLRRRRPSRPRSAG